MKAKEYLEQYKKIYGKFRRIEIRLEQLEASYIKSLELDGMPHGQTPGKPTERNALKLAEIKSELSDLLKETEVQRQEIADQIEKVKDPRYKELLFSRYVMLLPWDDVAIRVSISCRPGKEYEPKHIMGYMHSQALKAFDEVLNEGN